jgi:hypothetical protein
MSGSGIPRGRKAYLSVQTRMAADLLTRVAGEMAGEKEQARLLHKAARDARRVARALDTDEPLLPE